MKAEKENCELDVGGVEINYREHSMKMINSYPEHDVTLLR